MKSRVLGPISALVLGCFPVDPALAQGLNNSSKRFVSPAEIKRSDWAKPREMARTWRAAIVRVPTGKGRSKSISTAALANWIPRDGGKVPAVIYMHGCSGLWSGSKYRVKLMADLGFVVVAPASFARQKYAQSCDVKTNNADMFRDVLRLRQADASFAVQQLRKLPFVDQKKVVLMGLSQGGVTAATYKSGSGKTKVTHRIIEGWTCNAWWPEYDGLKASRSEPVISFVGANDPWYQTKWVKGHCGTKMKRNNGSVSVVFRQGKLARTHELLEHSAARTALKAFLQAQGLITEK